MTMRDCTPWSILHTRLYQDNRLSKSLITKRKRQIYWKTEAGKWWHQYQSLKNEFTGSEAFLVGSDYAMSNDKAIN